MKSVSKKIDLARRVAERLRALVPASAKLVVGVSGGADSTALLHALVAGGRDPNRLLAVHVNHGLRGQAAQRDERLVERLCARLGVVVKVYAPDVRGVSLSRKWSWEEAGRKLRQECFLEAARQFGARAVLLAHHQDDQAETVLFNFLRGTALRGLGGMLPARAFPHPDAPVGLKLIRPLLDVPKADLASYCRAYRLPWRLDRSNLDTAFTRNRLRRQLIPWLEKNINPGLRQVLARSAESAARDEVWLEACAQKALRSCAPVWSPARVSLPRLRLLRLPEPLRLRVLSLVWDRLGVPGKSQAHLARLERALLAGGEMAGSLPGGWRLRIGTRRAEIAGPSDGKMPGSAARPSRSSACGVQIRSCELPARRGKVPARSSVVYVDADKLTKPLICRARRAGDTLQPLGLGGRHKDIKKVFSEMRLPAAQRAEWPLVVMGEEIVWVYRGPLAECVKLDAASRRACKISLRPVS